MIALRDESFVVSHAALGAEAKKLVEQFEPDMIVLDLGLPGLCLFALLFVCLLRLAWERRGEGIVLAAGMTIAAVLVVECFSWTIQKVSSHVWLAAAAAILNAHRRERPLLSRPTPAWFPLGANLFFVADVANSSSISTTNS